MIQQAQPSTRVMLWSAPRSVSTAFERAIRMLAGVKVFHEPYSVAAYQGEERIFDRYRKVDSLARQSYLEVKHRLEATYAEYRAVFIKDMAYAITPRLDSLPSGYRHSFLIRNPERTIPSMHRIAASGRVPEWATCDPREAGFKQMWLLYQYLHDLTGEPPVVVESVDLLSRPHETMNAYCGAVGLPFEPSMLHWDRAKSTKEWDEWGEVWYATLMRSTGFADPQCGAKDLDALPIEIRNAIQDAQPHYRNLYRQRLQS